MTSQSKWRKSSMNGTIVLKPHDTIYRWVVVWRVNEYVRFRRFQIRYGNSNSASNLWAIEESEGIDGAWKTVDNYPTMVQANKQLDYKLAMLLLGTTNR
jgi:hypothetical protein